MEYQKIINLLENRSNQPSKFRIKNWVEINDDAPRVYNNNSQIKFKNSMLKSTLCYYSYACLIIEGTISSKAQAGDNPNNGDKEW